MTKLWWLSPSNSFSNHIAAGPARLAAAGASQGQTTVCPFYTALLQDNPAFARSLMTRTPYIDPLNHLQVALLQRHRAGDNDEKVKRTIHLTINGIATGLRNSG